MGDAAQHPPAWGVDVNALAAECDRLRRAIVEHRTTIHNAGTVRVDSRDEAAAEVKHAADERLWANVALDKGRVQRD